MQNTQKGVALQPPLTWPSEVVGGCKRLGGSYVGLPTIDLFQTSKPILFLDKGKFNPVVHSKAENKHPISHGYAPQSPVSPVVIGQITYSCLT
jgi:hypothetical protein